MQIFEEDPPQTPRCAGGGGLYPSTNTTPLNPLPVGLEKGILSLNHQPYTSAMCPNCPRAAEWAHGCCPKLVAKEYNKCIGDEIYPFFDERT